MSDKSLLPLVSVCIMSFNHRDYIRQCLDSILMQQTNFDYEIILGDDESTDGTREICIEYAQRHPDKIRLFLRSRKDVIYINGHATGRYNFLENLKQVRGKYIALCDGDDYWTDPLKLQRQVDFLEKNEEYVACFHPVYCLINNELTEDAVIEARYQMIENKNKIDVVDLLRHGNFIHTCSILFKSNIVEFPFEVFLAPAGDYVLFVLLGQKGLLKRLDEKMSVYRRGSGSYSALSSYEMRKKILGYHICILSFLKEENERRVFLEKTDIALDSFLQVYKNHILQSNEIISSNKTFWDLFKIIVSKVKRKLMCSLYCL